MKPAVYVNRGDALEAVHYASVAVVNAQNELTHYLGDPESVFMTRSSIKPFQLLPTLLSGAAKKFGFSSEQLAIMCGSHNGSDRHRKVVLANLEAAGNDVSMLQCGAHRPMRMEAAGLFPQNDEHLDPSRHNCSGKHSGFLALARYLGDDPAVYLNPESATQQSVKKYVADFCDYSLPKPFYGTDGCSAPNFPLPLVQLARSFQRLVSSEDSGSTLDQAVSTIRTAMFEHPFMVSGENRIDNDLCKTYPNNIICKIGAEGLEGLGFRKEGIGIAVKIHDGNFRALEPVVIEVLRQLGLLPEKRPFLERYIRPAVKNARGLTTGHIIAEFTLTKV